jgi:LPS sulfotransferase NodH/SAM-dependent methyltransferase
MKQTEVMPGKRKRREAEHNAERPVRRLTDPRLDFAGPVPLRKSYVVASTDRSGSTFLCSMLWRTGVLGAPAEYWNYRNRAKSKTIGIQMMERLGSSSPADYLTKLLACRTSANGVFGVNAHYFDFEEALNRFPKILERLSPLTYIYIRREDKLAQAVSMVKATQTGAWVSLANRKTEYLHYDRDLISSCLTFIEQQDRGWSRWFESHQIAPFVVIYESLAAHPAIIVRSIVELLGVQDDAPQQVLTPTFEKQSDDTNREWIARYRRETEVGCGVVTPTADARPLSQLDGIEAEPRSSVKGPTIGRKDAHVFDRLDKLRDGAIRPIDGKRLRHRYDAIVGSNRSLFANAKVLDIHCGDGRWSLAALDAGAAHVVGLDDQLKSVEAVRNACAKFGAKPASYEFVSEQIFPALRAYGPEVFDVIICQDLLGIPDLHFFFNHLRRLRPKHVILDTAIVGGKVPIAVFKFKQHDEYAVGEERRHASVSAVPNHEFIRILCDYFGFRWRVFDWSAAGIVDWTGIHDYERDRRRTYVLDRAI